MITGLYQLYQNLKQKGLIAKSWTFQDFKKEHKKKKNKPTIRVKLKYDKETKEVIKTLNHRKNLEQNKKLNKWFK